MSRKVALDGVASQAFRAAWVSHARRVGLERCTPLLVLMVQVSKWHSIVVGFMHCIRKVGLLMLKARVFAHQRRWNTNLVDPTSSHTLVSKIKP